MKKTTKQVAAKRSQPARAVQPKIADRQRQPRAGSVRVRLLDESGEAFGQFDLPAEHCAKLEAAAKARGVPVPALIQQAVREKLAGAERKADPSAALLSALRVSLADEEICGLEEAADDAGMLLAQYFVHAAREYADDRRERRLMFPDVPAVTFRAPMSRAMHDGLKAAAKARGVLVQTIVQEAVQSKLAGSSAAAASVPLRCCYTRADRARDRAVCPPVADKRNLALQIQTFGLDPTTCFEQVELLDFVCEVIDRHQEYLGLVLARELPASEQTALLEAIEYAETWRCREAKCTTHLENVFVGSMPGLSGRRVIERPDLLGWFAHLLGCNPMLDALRRHFLRAGVDLRSRIEWGDVLSICGEVLGLDDVVENLTPADQAEVKAAMLRSRLEERVESLKLQTA